MVSARGACPCLLIQTKQQPLVLRAEAKGGNQGYGFKAALLTLLGMGSRKRAHDEWDPRQWHMRCGWWSCLLLIFATQTQNPLRPWKQVANSNEEWHMQLTRHHIQKWMANLVLLMAHPFHNRSAEQQATREALLASRLQTITKCSAWLAGR